MAIQRRPGRERRLSRAVLPGAGDRGTGGIRRGPGDGQTRPASHSVGSWPGPRDRALGSTSAPGPTPTPRSGDKIPTAFELCSELTPGRSHATSSPSPGTYHTPNLRPIEVADVRLRQRQVNRGLFRPICAPGPLRQDHPSSPTGRGRITWRPAPRVRLTGPRGAGTGRVGFRASETPSAARAHVSGQRWVGWGEWFRAMSAGSAAHPPYGPAPPRRSGRRPRGPTDAASR